MPCGNRETSVPSLDAAFCGDILDPSCLHPLVVLDCASLENVCGKLDEDRDVPALNSDGAFARAALYNIVLVKQSTVVNKTHL